MSVQPELVDPIPLQQRGPLPVRDLGPYFKGVDRVFRRMRFSPAIEGEQLLDGRPYAAAPALATEVRHLLGLQRSALEIQAQGLQLRQAEVREVILRQAAVCDRLALFAPDKPDAEATAIEAAWELQAHDVDHRYLVRGEWQPDAIHWAPLTDDPGTGSRLYVRQEYALWLASLGPQAPSFFGGAVGRG